MKQKPFFIGLAIGLLMALTISTACEAKTFDDSEHWAKYYIDYVSDQGYMVGTSSTTFSPDEAVTRGMMAQVIANYADAELDSSSCPFTDVGDVYYYNAVCWCYEQGIIEGETPTRFYPDNWISREDMAVMLNRYLKLTTGCSCFDDWDDIDDYAKDDVSALYDAEIVSGDDGSYYPFRYLTRGELATVLARADGKTFDNYEVQPKLTYIGTYKLTYYCAACNSPAGSLQTASGATATVGRTIAVPSSMYSKYKGKTLYIENVGYRIVQDKCGTSAIDVFCSGGCSSQPLSGTYQKVYIVE